MPRFERSVVIDRSPQEVFDYITDPTHVPEWIEEIQSDDRTDEEHKPVHEWSMSVRGRHRDSGAAGTCRRSGRRRGW